MKKQENFKKIFIYVRYILPVLFHFAIIITAFIPSYRFIVGTEVGDVMSLSEFISLYWEKTRDVLFGASGDYTGSDEVFSGILFGAIILFAVLFIVSFAVSVWNAIVAFRVFLSDDEESAERGRKIFLAFVPNRIVATVLTSLGFFITLLPYFIAPISSLTGADKVTMVLETVDSLTVSAILFSLCGMVSTVSSYFEKDMGADVFAKEKREEDDEEDESEED